MLIKKSNVCNMLVLKYKFFYMHEHIRNIKTKDHKTNMHIKCVSYPLKTKCLPEPSKQNAKSYQLTTFMLTFCPVDIEKTKSYNFGSVYWLLDILKTKLTYI